MTIPPATDHQLARRFLRFLGPLVLANVLQALSGTLNIVYLGQLLGAPAMAAAAGFLPVFMLLSAFVIGLGTGASILVGQAHGARQSGTVNEVAGSVLTGGFLLGAALALAGVAMAQPLMRWLGTSPEILADATGYARVMLMGLPVFFTSMLAAAVLRGTGDSVTPLRALIVSCAVSALLTPALILGWLGLPRLGVASAAWGSLVAALASLGWLAWRLARTRHALAVAALAPYLRLSRRLLTVARLGIPTGLFFITSASADLALLALVNTHGVHATAAWGAVSQTIAYVLFPAMSIAVAASVFAAQAIGAGQLDQLDWVTRVGLGMNLLLTGGLATLVALASPWVAALFVKDAAVIELVATILRLSVWGSIFFGLASVFSGVMRAAGTVRVPTAISLSCLAFLLYPLGLTFEHLWGLPFVWLAYPATFGCALVLQALYFHGVWKQHPIRKLV